MKKKVIIGIISSVLAFLVVFLVVSGVIITVSNDNIAADTADYLYSLPRPINTQYIEKVSCAGKLVGNGNGMQYFGAVLIKSDLSLDRLENHYGLLLENGFTVHIEPQSDKKISQSEHIRLEFKSEVVSKGYYIMYAFGKTDNDLLKELDIRGH